MPLPACFQLADDVFPRVRAEAARRLSVDGWSQTRIAAALRVSQAMISKYVARTDLEDDPLVLRLTDELVTGIDTPGTADGPSAWCHVLSPALDRPGASDALDDLLAAERSLMEDPPIALVPQIGLNLARATPDATGPEDVLSFPGRIIAAGERLISPVPPAWGESNHLAGCLLALRAAGSAHGAIANVRGTQDVVRAAETDGHKVAVVDRQGDTSDASVLRCFQEGNPIVHDPGAVGIEACLYISGPSATAVASTIHSIHARLNE